MTTGSLDDESQSNYDVEQFRAFMQSMGVKTVKKMGTPQEIASVSSPPTLTNNHKLYRFLLN